MTTMTMITIDHFFLVMSAAVSSAAVDLSVEGQLADVSSKITAVEQQINDVAAQVDAAVQKRDKFETDSQNWSNLDRNVQRLRKEKEQLRDEKLLLQKQ